MRNFVAFYVHCNPSLLLLYTMSIFALYSYFNCKKRLCPKKTQMRRALFNSILFDLLLPRLPFSHIRVPYVLSFLRKIKQSFKNQKYPHRSTDHRQSTTYKSMSRKQNIVPKPSSLEFYRNFIELISSTIYLRRKKRNKMAK